MKRILLTAAAALAAGMLAGPIANADPSPLNPDPHVPNPSLGICPGGSGPYYCDGQPYDDGSKWHHVQASGGWLVTTINRTDCVIGEGINPPLAPPGACGGSWDGQPPA